MALDAKAMAAFLSGLSAADPSAMHAIFSARFPCNQGVAINSNVAVGDTVGHAGTRFDLGFLGILNGLLRADGSPEVVVARTGANGQLGDFVVLEAPPIPKAP